MFLTQTGLFGAIVKACVKHFGNLGSGLVGVPVAGDIVVDAWENWRKHNDEQKRREELQDYAHRAVRDVLRDVFAAIRQEAPGLPESTQQQLVDYLCGVHATIRRDVGKPARSKIKTFLHQGLLFSAEDLMLLLPSELPPARTGDQPLPGGLSMKFAWIPPGTFWMGGSRGHAGHQVDVTYEFYLGVYPVTQEQWQSIMQVNPSYFSDTGGGKRQVRTVASADQDQFPVENVSWDDTQLFLERLNAFKHQDGWMYRLPTAKEWEFACRWPSAEDKCPFDFYFQMPTNDLSSLQANFNGSYPAGQAEKGPNLSRPTKVGSYEPNRLGLYDMHGNVWEWCQDLLRTSLPRPAKGEGFDRYAVKENPPEQVRLIRGGGWADFGIDCRAGSRDRRTPEFRTNTIGLRLCRVRHEARRGQTVSSS
jgi:formylglycine-generating enzyme required for sulfatase activity